MTDRELMQQALEALQYASDETKPENLYGCDCLICKTINALRDRLAQPYTPDVTPEVTPYVIDCPRCGHCCPQPEQEPVLWMMPDGNTADKWALQFYGGQKGKPLYTTPPQQWVGLTDDDYETLSQYAFVEVIEKVEALLKEKNSG
jgi:hypothetical protein